MRERAGWGLWAMVPVVLSCADPARPGTSVSGGAGAPGPSANGAASAGGNAATGGSGITGGMAGAIGETAGGMAGKSAGGMAGAEDVGGSDAGGADGGTDISSATGGSSGMGGATRGSIGTGGDAGGGPVTLEGLVGALDGRLIVTPCRDTPNSDDCGSCYIIDGVITGCDEGVIDLVLDHPIGGVPGAMYAVTMHFYGIMEPKFYGPEAQREAGDTRPSNEASPLNPALGAEPAPWAVGRPGMEIPQSYWGTYEIHVLDENMEEVGLYFLNSDTEEGYFTYVIDYERTIPVVGGGSVRLRRYDWNCRVIKNCGTRGGTPCGQKARSVDISAANPAPPVQYETGVAGLQQPGLGLSPDHGGQWWLIDVTAFEPM